MLSRFPSLKRSDDDWRRQDMHTKEMEESEGDFTNGWTASDYPCRKCGGKQRRKTWESSCGGYEDEKYECLSCGNVWWLEGPDA